MPKSVVKHLLSTGEDADVYFLVGDEDAKELLPAHKLILKHASEVFAAMLRFDAIVSQKSDVEDFKIELDETVFNNEAKSWGFDVISFTELMDPSKGLYNKDEDKVTLAIDFTCE
ncbi:hypothetical protein niasHT_009504 [Heterodera trifolii]|uniref:BTB domain-containing protein n=1 Tax=Heterodera trifolii TaxID=157864 RepID=A0ABD2M762_9BILA